MIRSHCTHIHTQYHLSQTSLPIASCYLADLTSVSKKSISFWNKPKPQGNKNFVFGYNEFFEFYKQKPNAPMEEVLLTYTQTQIQAPKAHEIFSAASQILHPITVSTDRPNLTPSDLKMIKNVVFYILENYEHHLYFDQMELFTHAIVILNDSVIISNEEIKHLGDIIGNRLLVLSQNKSHFLHFKAQTTKILKNLTAIGYFPAKEIIDLIARDTLNNFKETPNPLLNDIVLVQSKSKPNNLQLYNEIKLHLLKGTQFYLKEQLIAKFTVEVKDKSVHQILRELGTKLLLQSYRKEDIQYQKNYRFTSSRIQ